VAVLVEPTLAHAAPGTLAAQIRRAILIGDLSPGEQIRQAEWAERLGVSRIPVREALKTLAAEGILQHGHNRGYFVTRFGPLEVAQIYQMRRLLEAALLRSLERPSPRKLDQLRRLARDAAAAKMGDDFESWNQLERRFHTELYALSPLNLICAEEQRLWILSNIYRMLAERSVGREPTSPMVTYYGDMVAALVANDSERMVQLMTHLRQGAEEGHARKLQRRSSAPRSASSYLA
jgi:DNA-binding GntR family transcriptional regulator